MDLNRILKEIEEDLAILIDVREEIEWEECRLLQSELYPLSTLHEIYTKLPLDKKIYTHCRKGMRAQEAASFLNSHGYDQAIPLKTTFEELWDLKF